MEQHLVGETEGQALGLPLKGVVEEDVALHWSCFARGLLQARACGKRDPLEEYSLVPFPAPSPAGVTS